MMGHSGQPLRPGQRRWQRRGRTAAAIIAAALALLAAACGASPSHAGSGSAPVGRGSASVPSAVAYSACIRSHGVPDYPDPAGNGQAPKISAQLLGVSDSQLQAAQTACKRLYPGNDAGGVLTKNSIGQCEETGDCPQTLVQAAMAALRAFARCMRSHGLPTWPDPTLDSEGRPGFNLLNVTGFDPNSTQTSNVMQACYQVMPGGVPVPVIAPGGPG